MGKSTYKQTRLAKLQYWSNNSKFLAYLHIGYASHRDRPYGSLHTATALY